MKMANLGFSLRFGRTVRRFSAIATAMLVMVAFTLPSALDGQEGVRYVTSTDIEWGGGLGSMMSQMGPQIPDEAVTFLQGTKMRADQGTTSTIFNWESGEMIILNHANQTYFSTPFGEMMAGVAGAAGMTAEMQAEMEAIANQIQVEMSIEDGGGSESFEGYPARQILMTMAMDMSGMADAGGGSGEMAGMAAMMGNMNMVYFGEMWMSEDHPAGALQAAMGEQAMEFMGQMANPGMGMLSMFTGGDGGDLFDLSADEMSLMRGIAVRTTAVMYMMAGGQEFDADEARGHLTGDLPSGGGLGGMMGAMMGGGSGGSAEMSPLMRVTSEVTEVEIMDMPASTFEVPTGYTMTEGIGG